jgi:hypothetical protein
VKNLPLSWLLYQEAKLWGVRPSQLLGLDRPGRSDDDGYTAYCFDQAVGHFGVSVEAELEQAGHRPTKDERKTEAARKSVLTKYFGEIAPEQQRGKYADPAAMM